MATKLLKTFTTATHWDVRYDVRAGTGTARWRGEGPTATFTVRTGDAMDLVVFVGHLPPHHVRESVQQWVSKGCPE